MRLPTIFGYAISVFILIFSSTWSAYTVGRGLITSKNFDGYPEWAIYCFAATLKAVISLSAIYLPAIFKKNTFKAWMAGLICIGVMAIFSGGELFHHIIAQVKNSQGAGLVNKHLSELQSIDKNLTQLALEIPLFAESLNEQYKNDEMRAREGRDASGIKKCRGICSAAIERQAIIGRYIQALSVISSNECTQQTNIKNALDCLFARASHIQTKEGTLQNMLIELNQYIKTSRHGTPIANTSLSAGISALKNTISTKITSSDRLNDITDVDLSMQISFNIIKNLINLNFNEISERSWLSIFYGLASFLSIVVSGILINHLGSIDTEQEIKQIEKELENQNKINSLLESLRKAKFSRFIADKWSENMDFFTHRK